MSGHLDTLNEDERSRLKREALPAWLAPMLARLTHDPFSDSGWIFERKLDGERVLAFIEKGRVRLMTRNRKDITSTYPELVPPLKAQPAANAVLDGEVVAFAGNVTSFSRLQQRMQRSGGGGNGVAIHFYLFDILYLDGYTLDGLPLRSRKQLLKRALRFEGRLRYTPHRNGGGLAYLKEACGKGWEGVIAKRAAAPYTHGRSGDWLKFKCNRGQELVVGGFTAPRGSRTGFGALLVGYYRDGRLRYAGKVGTGYDEKLLKSLRHRMDGIARKTSPFDDEISEKGVTWVSPRLVGEFGFTEWTRDGKLRHPRFLGLRRDKAAKNVVREEPGSAR